jgi:hypothetical protein
MPEIRVTQTVVEAVVTSQPLRLTQTVMEVAMSSQPLRLTQTVMEVAVSPATATAPARRRIKAVYF